MTEENWIRVGMSTCGLGAGAQEVYDFFSTELVKRKEKIQVKRVGCLGMCYAEPLVEVNIKGMPRVLYGNVDLEIAKEILARHIRDKKLVHDHIFYNESEEGSHA